MSRAFVTYATTARARQLEADANTLAIEYGRLVTEARVRYGVHIGRTFSVEDLARRASLPAHYVEALEAGRANRTPTLEVMYRIARVLRRHPAELLPIMGVVQ